MIETRLSSVLAPELILIGATAPTLALAIAQALGPAMTRANVKAADQSAILAAIDKRESSATTCVPPIALPHTRHAAAPVIIAALAINRDAVVEPDLRLLVPFVTPESAPSEHLRFLSGVARLLRSLEVQDEIFAARSADEVLGILRARNN
jgi:mannitol/fructose-specific phosphotransferase system IIA component (Ntr-type)